MPVTRGYAYLTGQALGWDYKVDGLNGTGYLKPGSDEARTYLGRIRALATDSGMQVVASCCAAVFSTIGTKPIARAFAA